MTTNILIAGFGGQGLLFAGKLLANMGMLAGVEISWLPSYGPEMRGGTANCSVILSDHPIGSPIVDRPDVLIAMNLPSLDKFEDAVISGGHIFIDNSLIARASVRSDATCHYVPATRLADENALPGLANMIMLGAYIGRCRNAWTDILAESLKKVIPARKVGMFDKNMEALRIGLALKEAEGA